MNKLPCYGKNKQTGNIAADVLKSILQRFAIVNPNDESIDLGIDMRAQIIEKTIPQEMFFNIQCKGIDELDITEIKECYNIKIKVSTLNYWNQQNETTFLFFVDNAKLNCYWCNPLLQLEDRINEIQNQDTVTIKVPLKNCISQYTAVLPNDFINCITLYLVKKSSRLSDLANQIKSAISGKYALDTESAYNILSILLKESNKIRNSYYDIAKTIIDNIKVRLEESYSVFVKLDHIPCAKQWCKNGVLSDKGFSKDSKNSINDLKNESVKLINRFENEKENVELLKNLKSCEDELIYMYKNALAFLYEMECEDDPFGDHSELEKLCKERVYNHINLKDPDNSNY